MSPSPRSLVRILGGVSLAVVTLLAAGAPPVAGQTTPGALESFHGTWVLASGERELHQALDRVVDQLNLFIREIARHEMHRRITPERRIRFEVADTENVAVSWDAWGPHRLSVAAPSRRLRGPQGDHIRASMRFRSGQLVHHHRADSGARYSTYRLSSDEQRMTMSVRITSDQLPVDIRYRLHYRRR